MSPLQNRAMHKYFDELALEFNRAGLDMKKVLKPGVEIPWSEQSVKEHLWRPIQIILLDKVSTTELEDSEPQKVFEVLNKHIGEKFGVHVPWPSKEELFYKAQGRAATYEN